jgi:hypothetical protein
MPLPKYIWQYRFTATRAVNGLAGSAIQRARETIVGGSVVQRRQGGNPTLDSVVRKIISAALQQESLAVKFEFCAARGKVEQESNM